MIERPKVRYTLAEDGTSIAYSVFGEGDLTILLAFSSFLTHLERDWDHPGRARFYEQLAGFARVILTDRRNMGMSDPGPATGSLDTIAADLVAVLDATGADRVSMVAIGSPATALALPGVASERVDRVVLHNANPAWSKTEANPHGYSSSVLERWAEQIRRRVAEGDSSQWQQIGGMTPAEVGLTPGNSVSHLRWMFGLDATPCLEQIQQPVLVIRTDGTDVPRGATEAMVARLLDPTLVHLEGSQEPFLRDDIGALVGLIEEFLTGRRTARAAERRLASIVFTDIVGSTQMATELGPDAWRQLLDTHDRLTRRVVRRHDGTYVKSTGDGALAVFTLPDAALAAMAELHRALSAAGVPIRAGAHVGVIEERGEDVSGLAVHTASRIADVGDAGDSVVSVGVLDESSGAGWDALGPVVLKGIGVPHQLYRSRP